MKAMSCRNCGAGLEADGIDASLRVATCGHCGSLHELPSDSFNDPSRGQPAEINSSPPATKTERVEVAMPKRFTVQRGTGSMEVSWKVGGIFHGVVLLVMVGAFTNAALTSGAYFILLGSVALLYFAAVRTFNKHRVRVDGTGLQVTQVPLPWPGARKLAVSDIDQLYATEYATSSQNQRNHGSRRERSRKYYRLSATTSDGSRMTILSGLHDPLQALWLEQELERLLNISDKVVAGSHVQ